MSFLKKNKNKKQSQQLTRTSLNWEALELDTWVSANMRGKKKSTEWPKVQCVGQNIAVYSSCLTQNIQVGY